MADITITPELRNELLGAQSAQEVRDILAAAEQELGAEEMERLWQEIEHSRVDYDRDVSDDELAAVAGGESGLIPTRSVKNDGCAATVEKFSWCWSNDYCLMIDVRYES